MPDTISSIKHPAVTSARADLESGAAFLVEGRSLVLAALAAHAPLQGVFFLQPRGDRDVRVAAEQDSVSCHLVTRGVFSRIVDLKYEPATRVVGVVEVVRRSLADLLAALAPDTTLLVAENLQDPRNVGVLVRTADAWGLKSVVFTEGSADPFSRAAVRASTGSILRVGVTTGVELGGLLSSLRRRGVRLVGTSAAAETASWDADLRPPLALLLGNETTGLSQTARAQADRLVRIPMYGGAHSFNITVAAGILLYESARQRAKGDGTTDVHR